MKVKYATLIICVMACMMLPAQAAYEYTFEPKPYEFYQTPTQTVIQSEKSNTIVTAPGEDSPNIIYAAPEQYIAPVSSDTYPGEVWNETQQSGVSNFVQLTSVDSLKRSDGSIGTLSIPKLSLNVKVYEGETLANMRKGVGHFTGTSAWDGNVSICGHNRGVTWHFGGLKTLDYGDRITYTTNLGTRTYRVSSIDRISSTDTSILNPTANNMLTLVTCVENRPSLRLCVKADLES